MKNQSQNNQKGKINKDNYIYHEILDIKGKKDLVQENLEIIEDLNTIHEIKEIRNSSYNTYNQSLRNRKRFPEEVEIRLEGEPPKRKRYTTNIEYLEENTNNNFNNLYPEYQYNSNEWNNQWSQNNQRLYNKYQYNYKEQTDSIGSNKNIDNNFSNEVNIGYVNAPFLFEENNEKLNDKDRNDLIESICKQLRNGKILEGDNNLKITFKVLNKEEKNKVIEEVKNRIENELEKTRFNKFINII